MGRKLTNIEESYEELYNRRKRQLEANRNATRKSRLNKKKFCLFQNQISDMSVECLM